MTRLITGLCLLAIGGFVSACRSAPPTPDAAPEDPPALAVTVWTDRTELFLEHPPLVAGADARFAIHLTDLATFAPVREGRVVVRFEGDTIQRFEVDGPSSPGIFGVNVKVPAPRRYQIAIELHGTKLSDDIRAGVVTVHPNATAALAAVPEDLAEGATPFLKEQQWTLDFATAVVDRSPRAATVSVPATIEPRAGGRVDVRAPAAGRIVAGGARALGTRVSQGDVLVEMVARNERPGEAPVLRLEVAAAEAELRLARDTLARVERLAAAGAVPQRRLAEARKTEETAAARVAIAQEQVRQLELTRAGEGAGSPDERLVARAPITGVLADAHVTLGGTVQEGQLLFQIVALDRVHVVGNVPEQYLVATQKVTTAEIEVPGLAAPLRTTRLVSHGRVVDSASRSVPVIFELNRPPSAIAVGQAVVLRLILPVGSADVAIPSDAVVDDAGQPIVFVQAGGESFERRPVRLGGPRAGGYVEITDGLSPGDRIVTRGAHLIRLAALSPQTPGHGHVH